MIISRLKEPERAGARLLDIVRDFDGDLDEKEARLAESEEDVSRQERELEKNLEIVRERQIRLLDHIESLDDELEDEVKALHDSLPGLAPSLSKRDRQRATKARREAIASREAALRSREKMISMVTQGLSALGSTIEEGEEELRLLTDEAERRAAAQVAHEVAARKSAAEARSAGESQRRLAEEGARARTEGFVQGLPQRLQPRARLDCEVDLGTENNFYNGFAQNVSAGGLFVATFDLVPVGSEIDLSFSLPTGRRVSTRAVVRWVREANEMTPDVWPGLGLQFQNLGPEAVEAIEDFVREREPLFFPDA